MSEGEKRRAQILEILRESKQPVSGTDPGGQTPCEQTGDCTGCGALKSRK